METAGEGGAWGIALLADYMVSRDENESLTDFLANKVFAGTAGESMDPVEADVKGYEAFMERYMKGLAVERAAVLRLQKTQPKYRRSTTGLRDNMGQYSLESGEGVKSDQY